MELNKWFKSTKSGNNGSCVEVRYRSPAIDVRDTKDHGQGPELAFTSQEWSAFVEGAKRGEFDLT